MTAPALLANLGAEEGGDWRRHAEDPAVAAAASLWRQLFEHPPALGFLAEVEAAAWWNSAEAIAWAEADGRRLFGASPELTRAVHDKAFALQVARAEGLLPEPFARARIFDPAELADASTVGAAVAQLRQELDGAVGTLTLKPRLGSSGRGRVAIGPEGPDASLEGALARLAARGGAVLEPWVERRGDYSTQLLIEADGRIRLLATLEQITTASGQVRGHRGTVDSRGRVASGSPFDEALREAALAVGLAAAELGYRGPLGVDAFAFGWQGDASATLRPVVECNARFTLGLVALDRVRRALPQLRERLGLAPGVLLPFCFVLDAPPGGWPADGEASAGPGWPADGEASAGPESDLWLEPATVPGPAAPGLLVARSVEGLEAVAFAARVPSGGPARARIRGSAPPRLGAQKGGR